jgi:hypothetical protein
VYRSSTRGLGTAGCYLQSFIGRAFLVKINKSRESSKEYA